MWCSIKRFNSKIAKWWIRSEEILKMWCRSMRAISSSPTQANNLKPPPKANSWSSPTTSHTTSASIKWRRTSLIWKITSSADRRTKCRMQVSRMTELTTWLRTIAKCSCTAAKTGNSTTIRNCHRCRVSMLRLIIITARKMYNKTKFKQNKKLPSRWTYP